MNKREFEINNDFLDLAYKFWQLSENAINFMENTGNQNLVFTNGKYSMKDSWSIANEIIKYNSNSIGVPVLFNFYHGLELFMKGFMTTEKILEDKTHSLTDLYKYLRTNKSAPDNVVNTLKLILFSKEENSLNSFFVKNKTNLDNFYQNFKYPIIQTKKGYKNINYHSLTMDGDLGLESYCLIKNYIKLLYNSVIEFLNDDKEIISMLKK